ncbi:MAG: BON domain-containing protein [Acidobacteriia bacterium]|nr:BON domain-containing protein [Terriglobia bacterium]
MKNTLALKLVKIGCAILLTAIPALPQEHKWAGRTLDGLEWRIHVELAMLPFQGVFDTLRFEVQGRTVTLSGQVVRETVKVNAERVVKRLEGVDSVINQIEVLPSSRRDDAIRMNVYRAIYESRPLDRYGTRALPPIHIIVRDGAVTLEGLVDSEPDRNMAFLRALKATHHVTNNLRVAPEE